MNWFRRSLPVKEQPRQHPEHAADDDLRREVEENLERLAKHRHQTKEKEQIEWQKTSTTKLTD